MFADEAYIDRRRLANDVVSIANPLAHMLDVKRAVNVVKIFSGKWHISKNGDEMLSTILGSCVAVCMRDPSTGVGGMNHFLLPSAYNESDEVCASARYGAYAMECLINGLLDAGAKKERFEVKVFGGGNILKNGSRIGSINAAFIRDYLKRERYRIVSEDLEGELPRRLHYYPASGRVMLRHLRRVDDLAVMEEEDRYSKLIISKPIEGSIELF